MQHLHNPNTSVRVIDDVGDWIDPYNLAELVYRAIKQEFGIRPTVEQCQQVWLRVLDCLGDNVRDSVRALHVDFD